MPSPDRKFERLSLTGFFDVLSQYPFRRRINAVHMHHTYRPTHAQYRRDPERAILGMWRHHTQERRFSDIAQHITIGPDGEIWLGRNWDMPPASATGHNGNLVAGPFMFEMIGDFDRGGDPFCDPQRHAVFQVIARVQDLFRLPVESLRFHNHMAAKSCPGTQLTYDDVLQAVRELRAELERERAAPRRPGIFGEEALPVRETTRRVVEMLGGVRAPVLAVLDEGELHEEEMDFDEERALAGGPPAITALAGRTVADERGLTPDEAERLRPHVVNLRFGAFSGAGLFRTAPEDIDVIFEEDLQRALKAARSENRKLKLLFYAHGGLISESAGLAIALDQVEFWKRNKVYPIFFVWETGLLETVSDILKRSLLATRGLVSDFSDLVLESIARPAGTAVWTQMKRSAEVSVLSGGGALYVAQRTAEFVRENLESVEIHAVGHSAGSIFHAHFLPALLDNGVKAIQTLQFLAPAITVPLFRQKLLPLLGDRIENLTMFTMKRSHELADTAGPYRKSLLYLVHHSFEQPREAPILGLEEHLRADREVARCFGLNGGGPQGGEVVFSRTAPDAPLRSASCSLTHGGFDNDAATMNSTLRRVLDTGDEAPIFEFPKRGAQLFAQEVQILEQPVLVPAVPPAVGPPVAAPAVVIGAERDGRRRALCVGINAYQPPSELNGCVADAHNWGSALQALGFETHFLLDAQATGSAIITELSSLIRDSAPGDIVVFQFAGHGTTVKDLDGDEEDGRDEALCPVDYEDGGFVIDDDLRAIFESTPAGVNVTCFIDCCHSGTITRLVSGIAEENVRAGISKRRFIRATPAMEAAHRSYRARAGRARPGKLRGPEEMNEVLFSACLPSEVAYETAGNGDFTSRAIPVMRAGVAGLTNAEFQRRVTAAFGTPARQHPNMDCAPDAASRPFLQPPAAPAPAGPPRAAAARALRGS